ncbi:hypothetical protein CAEBREN_23554 [Caenorhabditis brenneri]|uniref:F-box domain-containing protein n=1 Tax=Caenorhabditis brenneri TaxID=135651 RepID=G0NSV9_CAEBE|nr:hypothetical protein CAEBREN_23554 [Caenorhabditis brenneri]
MERLPRFPLLRLPFIPMEIVIRLMDVPEQYKMATVSKKATKLVTLSLSRKTFFARFFFRQILKFDIWNSETKSSFAVEIEYPAPEEYTRMESIRSHIEFMKIVFHLKDIQLNFQTYRPPGLESGLISVFEEYLVISNLTLYTHIDGQTNDELYLYILKKCCHYSRLYIYMDTTANFKLPVSDCPMFSCDELVLTKPHWATVDHFATNLENVKQLVISETQFNAKEANKFIKSWINGSRIEGLILDLKDDTVFRRVFRDIDDAIEIREAVVHCYLCHFEEGEAFVVKQADGKEAIVYEMDDSLFLQTEFSRDLSDYDDDLFL